MKPLQSASVRRAVVAFLCVITLFYLTACNFYKVNTYGPDYLDELAPIQARKLMFLHNGPDLYLIRKVGWKSGEQGKIIMISMDKEAYVEGKTGAPVKKIPNLYVEEPVKKEKPPYLYNPKSGKSYSPRKEGNILREVHFYLNDTLPDLKNGVNYLPSETVGSIHVLERDKGMSTGMTILTAAGIPLLILGTGALILALSSCPYVYVYDGEQFVFQGEVYGGAVLQNLERNEYLPLPGLRPVNGECRVRIANELQERQYVNMAELVQVFHTQGTKVLLDGAGTPRLITNPTLPASALSASGVDQKHRIGTVDQTAFLFDELDAISNSLTLSFKRIPAATKAKLVLNAKNSMWAEYIIGRFGEKAGSKYDALMSRLGAMSPEERQQQQVNQDFPLSVFIKDNQGQWQLAGRLPMAGPLGWKDLVLPVDLNGVPSETVELRLETGYRFWELDYAALDFSDDTGMEVSVIKPGTAIDQHGRSQLPVLGADDSQYLIQPQPGDFADLHFKATRVAAGQQQSFFLHTKGYYEHIRYYRQAPDLAELEKFRQPHYFDQFSRMEFQRILHMNEVTSDEEALH